MSWTQLAGEVKNLISFFSKNNTGLPYPRAQKDLIINNFNKENWNKTDLRYSFKVVDKDNGFSPTGDASQGPPKPLFKEFKLQINPTEITQDENFAVNITPTQNAVISEHNGIIFRDLVISGTTGVHPLRGVGGVTRKGKAIGAAPGSRSGYEEFQQLRNYFRAYALHKESPRGKNSVLVYVNRKDTEELIIEPLKFSKKRQGPKGPLYYYTLTAKVIGNRKPSKLKKAIGFFATLDNVTATVTDFLDTSRGVLLKSNDLLVSLERNIGDTLFEPLRLFSLSMKTLAGVGTTLSEMPDSLINRFSAALSLQFFEELLSTQEQPDNRVPTNIEQASTRGGAALLDLPPELLLDILGDEENLPDDLANEYSELKINSEDLPRSFFENLNETVVRLSDNATEAFGLGDEAYNGFADRIQTFVPSPTKQTTNEEIGILRAFELVRAAINLVRAYGGDQFDSDLEEDFAFTEEQFDNQIQVPVPGSVNEIVIPFGATLEDLAFQNLNDMSRWIELARLNNLVAPYIEEISTKARVKSFGDKLLIPSDGVQIDTNVRVVKENRFNRNLTETEKRLGIDIKLDDKGDFIFNNSGDVEVITGGSNAAQQIRTKFNLEKGDLKYHPDIGIGLGVGTKITEADQLYDQIVETILQDPRFEEITSLELSVEGSTINANLNLRVAESAAPVPISLVF